MDTACTPETSATSPTNTQCNNRRTELRTIIDDRINDPSDNMDMRFGLWDVRSLYRAGSLMTVSRKLSKYTLELVGVQEVRWEGGGTERVGEYTFFYGKWNENHELGTG
jgi:hypothetical protein